MLNSVLRSVIKIYCTFTKPNYSSPWQMERQANATSSGFVIEGKRIICNAHGVEFHSSVRVRKHGDSTKYTAQVLHIGHECDLALLTVDDPAFWEGLEALRFGSVPNLQDEVICVGYPTGGDNISVTQGIVSRVAVAKYSHADESLLVIQIDAAINAGNSGGPALDNAQNVVGVAFETLDGAENIGYIIPTEVIKHFLTDIRKSNAYKGFCSSAFQWQAIENKCMRESLKIKNSDQGILVGKIAPLSDAANHLKMHDVVLEFDGVSIASDGTVEFPGRGGERISFLHLIASKYVGDVGNFKIMREGKEMNVNIILEKRLELVRAHLYDTSPSWFIYAGLVFSVLTCPFLMTEYGNKWDKKAPIDLCEKAFYGMPQFEGEEVVVLSQVLISDVNIGYEDFENVIVVECNGVKVRNIRQLLSLVRKTEGEYLKLLLSKCNTVVVGCKRAKQEHDKVLKDNSIAEDMSSDLKEWLAGQEASGVKETKPRGRGRPKKTKATPKTNTPKTKATPKRSRPVSRATRTSKRKKSTSQS